MLGRVFLSRRGEGSCRLLPSATGWPRLASLSHRVPDFSTRGSSTTGSTRTGSCPIATLASDTVNGFPKAGSLSTMIYSYNCNPPTSFLVSGCSKAVTIESRARVAIDGARLRPICDLSSPSSTRGTGSFRRSSRKSPRDASGGPAARPSCARPGKSGSTR